MRKKNGVAMVRIKKKERKKEKKKKELRSLFLLFSIKFTHFFVVFL